MLIATELTITTKKECVRCARRKYIRQQINRHFFKYK